MKRAILPALAFACLLALPALPQGSGDEELQKRIDDLEEQVVANAELLVQFKTYLHENKLAAVALYKATESAEKGGVLLPIPANDARKLFLYGVRDFAKAVAADAKPKKKK